MVLMILSNTVSLRPKMRFKYRELKRILGLQKITLNFNFFLFHFIMQLITWITNFEYAEFSGVNDFIQFRFLAPPKIRFKHRELKRIKGLQKLPSSVPSPHSTLCTPQIIICDETV